VERLWPAAQFAPSLARRGAAGKDKSMSRMRADQLLVARGLAESRAKARAAIEAGGVTANGTVVRTAAQMLEEGADIVAAAAHPWASRGGVKLAHGLDVFGVAPHGRVCMDVGASTGGFTDVLLSRGAARVFAVDVGRGQLLARLRDDARITVLEQTDARALSAQIIDAPPSLIVCDVSFIGAAKALAAPLALAAQTADLIVLIKPQFEAGPGKANKAGVLDEQVARDAAATALKDLDGAEGFRLAGICDSPIRGGDGNLELLAHLLRT
jgi:23S rRNA (cytidine1920-2'-O)/16S rRNA (cytidine1409-2'-O)-methyltransferase